MPSRNPSDFNDVGDFHHKFGLHSVNHNGAGPQETNDELLRFRIKFLLEELTEYVEALGGSLEAEVRLPLPIENIDHAQAFDALIDLVYVALGTAHLQGYPWSDGWRLVQMANMAKVRAQSAEESKRGTAFDVIKPPGWIAPDIESLLTTWGFPTSLNNPDLEPCNDCGIVKGEHHSEIDHNWKKTSRR